MKIQSRFVVSRLIAATVTFFLLAGAVHSSWDARRYGTGSGSDLIGLSLSVVMMHRVATAPRTVPENPQPGCVEESFRTAFSISQVPRAENFSCELFRLGAHYQVKAANTERCKTPTPRVRLIPRPNQKGGRLCLAL